MRIIFTFLLLSFFVIAGYSQNTVGLISYDPMKSYDGYNIMYPHNQPNVYLLNNCGEIVHIWSDSAQYRPGNTAYLMANGDLVKTKRSFDNSGNSINAGGGGATVEIRDWDNNLKWTYTLNDSLRRLHHDIALTNDGNILMVVWEYKSLQEVLDAGRDTSILNRDEMWPDYVQEVNPNTDEIVWEWHTWDHLIQDFDSTKNNYGVISTDPGSININYPPTVSGPDWMHVNAIDYDPINDLVAISVPTFSEVWFIDHSTTTAQAASHEGGMSTIGGDLMFRWGNPAAYQRGDSSDQKIFYQHDVQWVDDYLPVSHPMYGRFALFNNRIGADFSAAHILSPVFDMYEYRFLTQDGKWLPNDFDETYTHPEPTKMYSAGLSSIQVLPNGNTLLCAGRLGYSFELTPTNDIVWEYKTPLQGGNPVAQGTSLAPGVNNTFRMNRIPVDYSAFQGRDLSPQGYLELNPNLTLCDSLSATMGPRISYDLNVFPNPVNDQLTIEWNGPEMVKIDVYDVLGRPHFSFETYGGRTFINTATWKKGYHFIMIDGRATKVVLVE